MSIRTKIILVGLGSPDSPDVEDVRKYLKLFLSSRRVVDLPLWIWWTILNLFIIPFRAKKSADKYSRIWDGEEFPLVKLSNSFAVKLGEYLKGKVSDTVEVISIFILPKNGFETVTLSGEKEKLIIVPMFPQFSESTSMLVLDSFYDVYSKRSSVPSFEFVSSFYDSVEFISSCSDKIEKFLAGKQIDHLLLSFHGIPEIRVTTKGDPYLTHCQSTYELLKSELIKKGVLKEDEISLSFQSRFGKGKWLGPSTKSESFRLVKEGKKNLALFSPSFVVDCLETIEELGIDLKGQVEQRGGSVVLVPSLNDDSEWRDKFGTFILSLLHRQ